MKVKMNAYHPSKILLAVAVFGTLFGYLSSRTCLAGNFNDAKYLYQNKNYDEALRQLIPLAIAGDADAAYLTGKIYHDENVKVADGSLNAIFWLLWAKQRNDSQSLSILQEYSRDGYKYLIHRTESLMKEEMRVHIQDGNSIIFPEKVKVDIQSYWHAVIGQMKKEEIRAAALAELVGKTDVEICRDAIDIKFNSWDADYYNSGAVEDAARRNLTLAKCRDALTSAAFPN